MVRAQGPGVGPGVDAEGTAEEPGMPGVEHASGLTITVTESNMSTTMTSGLRLTATEQDVLPFERRGETRRSLGGHVTAVRPGSMPDGTLQRIHSLQLLNMSDGGLGAIVQEPVDVGSRIAVFFPPHGPERGFDLYGRVVRCERKTQGFEVGVRFEHRAAA